MISTRLVELVIDTVVCLTLAKWETVSGQFGGYLRNRPMKRCAQCHGKLGLGVRSRNLWSGHWWVHVRFCSIRCEALFTSWSKYDANASRWRTLLVRRSPQT